MKSSDADSLEDDRQTVGRFFRDGRLSEAIELQRKIVDAQQGVRIFPVEDYRALAFFLSRAREHEAAVSVLHQARQKRPKDFRILRDIGRNLILLKRPDEAIEILERAREIRRDDVQIHDALTEAYGLAGDLERAAKAGEISLLLKAKETARRRFKRLPAKKPHPFSGEVPARNIIAFSLGNPDARALRRALVNVRNARGIYPEWICRFYVSRDASWKIMNRILDAGAQVVQVSGRGRLREGSLWNLHVLTDENVDYFLLRDARCVVNARERAAVDDWLESGKWFHVMRDHHTHTDLVMPGMWGGARTGLPGVRDMLEELESEKGVTHSLLRTLLGRCVWPRIRRSACIHDSVHRSLKARDFPKETALPDGQYVGQVVSPPVTIERRVRARERDDESQLSVNIIESDEERLDLILPGPAEDLP